MQCNCKVTNNSGQTIESLILYHAAGTVLPGSLQTVLQATNLATGTSTPIGSATQESFRDDWWAMGVRFAGDKTNYLLSNDLLAYAECETPANGSAEVEIGNADGEGYPCTISTFHHSDFTDGDGSASEEVITQAQLNQNDRITLQIIEQVEQALGNDDC